MIFLKLNIDKLYLSSFGKFQQKEIDFTEGFNIVYGENEAGKSTIHAFLKAIFYDFESKGKVDNILKNKYQPWSYENYFGSMEFSYGKRYLIYRDFKNEKCDLKCLDEPGIEFSDKRSPGEIFMGVNSAVFDKIINIKLVDPILDLDDKNYIREYLINLVHSEASRLDTKKIEDELQKEISSIGTDRISNKIVGNINREIKSIKDRLKKSFLINRDLKDIKTRMSNLKGKIEKLDKEIIWIGIYNRLYSELISVNREFKFDHNQDYESVMKTDLKEFEYLLDLDLYIKDAYDNKKNIELILLSENKISKYISILLLIISLILVFIFNASFLTRLLYSSMILGAFYLYHRYNKNKKSESKDELEEEYNAINSEIERLNKEKSEILSDIGAEDIDDYSKLLAKKPIYESANYFDVKDDDKDIDIKVCFLDESLDYLKSVDIEDKNRDRDNIKSELIIINHRIEELESENKELRLLEEKLSDLMKSKEEILIEAEIDRMILNAIKSAKSCVSKNINSEISLRVGEILSEMTSEKYSRVLIGDDLEIEIFDERLNNFVPIYSLSTGTIQTVYLAFRLSLNEINNRNNKLPLILDDAVSHIDENRRRNIHRYLVARSKSSQIIYFTNNREELDEISNIYDNYNIINLMEKI
ncbi:MAG: AAA family ATPase [Tissierellia bacterium]|nr:AAA family ATPase [Tissierellia bacterium]